MQSMVGYASHAGRGDYLNLGSCSASTLWAIGPVPVPYCPMCNVLIAPKGIHTVGKGFGSESNGRI